MGYHQMNNKMSGGGHHGQRKRRSMKTNILGPASPCLLSPSMLEPTPIDTSRIVTVSKVPLDGSPLERLLVDEENLAALCDVLRSQRPHQTNKTFFQSSPRPSSPSTSLVVIGLSPPNETSLMLESSSFNGDAELYDCFSKNPENGIIASRSNDSIHERLRTNDDPESFGNGGKTHEAFLVSSSSCFDDGHFVWLNHVDPTTSNSSSCSLSSSSELPSCCDNTSIIPAQPTTSFARAAGATVTFSKESPKKNGDSTSSTTTGAAASTRFRNNQTEQWYHRYLDMVEFRKKYGHCLVPLNWPTNPSLAHWVKRQRRQFRAKQDHRHSTLTPERQWLLEQMGFVWDSHASVWEERLKELHGFRKQHGHCHVPKTYDANPQLAIWVKCQRRQFKLYSEGKDSNMTIQRIHKLQQYGFVFTPREKKKARKDC